MNIVQMYRKQITFIYHKAMKMIIYNYIQV